jgi:hypothetical protein
MASWSDTFKSYLNTNTMKNPLDSILPKIGINRPNGAKPPVIKPSPIKAKVKDTVTKVNTSLKGFETDVSYIVIFIIIGYILWFITDRKK